jgi:hypothetical protein
VRKAQHRADNLSGPSGTTSCAPLVGHPRVGCAGKLQLSSFPCCSSSGGESTGALRGNTNRRARRSGSPWETETVESSVTPLHSRALPTEPWRALPTSGEPLLVTFMLWQARLSVSTMREACLSQVPGGWSSTPGQEAGGICIPNPQEQDLRAFRAGGAGPLGASPSGAVSPRA